MADQYPFRNVHTGLVQLLEDDQAAIFPGAFEKLADDWEAREAQAAEAAALLEVAKADGSKAEVKDAKAAAADADKAAADVVVEPATTPDDASKES